MRKVVGFTNQFGKLCEIVTNGEEVSVEETKQECIE
jgi:hypothetical protein